MSAPLAGKVALVTGASRGIGKAIALKLAQDGANVVINYVSSAGPAEDLVKQIGSDRAIAIQADMTSVAAGKSLLEQTVSKWGRIDILVLNAALLAQNGTLENTTEDQFDKLYACNVKAPYFMIQAALPHIPKGGRVVLFSTSLTASSNITPNYLLYVSTKGAIEQMTRVLAKDLGKRGITVNCISPGPTATDGFYEGKNDQIVKMIESSIPFGRLGQVEEIADMVSVIVRPEGRWVNGQNIRVNGGMTVN
ncbi:putative short chain type dehydrogenase [Myriangium duriaei CBS 260.36]|uniref:Short chain type dehydrogenase n=1 Tax=Myriangium duriaei CBS 260.36 TaxID=1168546 RepID=A0A9P4MK02_9PEZI|nr:putative short chain type dehydrogenase [Myriangium duriaei CBS 260.36]